MKWIFVPTTDDSDYKSHDTMTDPATHIFKRFVGKTEKFHTKLQKEDFEFVSLSKSDDGTKCDVEHFAPNDGELEMMLRDWIDGEMAKLTEEAEEDGTPAPSRLDAVLRIKTQFETAIGDGYTAEDILADYLDMEECCAYCWYGFGGDVPNYINDIYRRLGLSSKTCDKVSRHEDFVVGVIVSGVSQHILDYFLEGLRRLELEDTATA